MAKSGRKKHTGIKVFLFLLIILILSAGGSYYYMKSQCNPSKIAHKFADAFMAGDISAIHSFLGMDDETLVSEPLLQKYLTDHCNFGKLTSYSFIEVASSDPNKKTYSLHYICEGKAQGYDMSVTLIKNPTPLYLLFDNWQVDASDYISSYILFSAPSGSKVSIDDNPLDEKMIVEKQGTVSVYNIPKIIPGEHKLDVELEGFKKFSTTIKLAAGNYDGASIYKITPSTMSLTDTTDQQLKDTAKSFIYELYDMAMKNRTFDELSSHYSIEKNSFETMKQNYQMLINNNFSTETHLTSVDFSNCDSKIEIGVAEDGCFAVNVISDTSYIAGSFVSIQEKTDTGDTLVNQYNRSTDGKSTFTTTFHYKDGKWSIYECNALTNYVYFLKY